MKTDKPDSLDDGMSKSAAIQLMSILASVVMGPEQFEKSSPEFQMLVFSSAGLVDAINEKGLMEIISSVDEATVGPLDLSDCAKLRILKATIDQAVYELCDTCRTAEPTGPAVCDLGNYGPKAVE